MYYRAYHQACSIQEALTIFRKTTNPQYIAGGTDLMVQCHNQYGKLKSLVDISCIPELKEIRQAGPEICIGAAVTFQEVIDSPLIQKEAPLLVHASQQTGAAQIQHMGTIGGNIANASPAGDMLPSLYILDASLILVSKTGERKIRISEFIRGVRQTALHPGELIKEICFHKLPGATGTAFLKYGLRESQAISVVSIAAILEFGDNMIRSARIALGAAAPTIVRCTEAEAYLIGRSPSHEIFEQAGETARGNANPIGDVRGSAEFRKYLVKPLTRQCLENAWSQCKSQIDQGG